MIRYEQIIDKKGVIVTTAMERVGTSCSVVKETAAGIGTEISDEITGPDCEPSHATEQSSGG